MNASPVAAGTVLVVDDSPPTRRLVCACLAALGLDVLEAADVASALRLLRRRLVDLIITDINMPVADGFRLIEAVREGLGDVSTPILVLSSEDAPAKAARARSAGASAWLAKPFTPDSLVGAVQSLLVPADKAA